jgi:hypothetical protein
MPAMCREPGGALPISAMVDRIDLVENAPSVLDLMSADMESHSPRAMSSAGFVATLDWRLAVLNGTPNAREHDCNVQPADGMTSNEVCNRY